MTSTKTQNIQSTPDRILDAAEELFSRRGFYGASLRDIAKLADVQMSMVNYHFGPKEDLFRHAVARRANVHVKAIADSLQETLDACGDAGPTLQDLIRAMLKPILEKYVSGGPGWRNYIQLLCRASHQHHEANFIAPFVEIYQPTMNRYTDEFLKLFPCEQDEDVFLSIIFLQAAFGNLMLGSTLPERVSRGRMEEVDFASVLDKMVQFFAAGFTSITDWRTAAPRNAANRNQAASSGNTRKTAAS